MKHIFTTGKHTFLMPSEQIEEVKETAFTDFIYAIPAFAEEHIELEAWKCRWTTTMMNAKLFIEKNHELVIKVNADGLVIDADDLSVAEARDIIGNHKKILAKVCTLDDAQRMVSEGVDGLLIGPLSYAKEPKLSMDEASNMIAQLREQKCKVPIYLFGGIRPEMIAALNAMNCDGISVSSFVLGSDELRDNALLFK